MREIQSELEADNISVFVIKEAGDDTSLTAGFLTVDLASPLASSDVIPRDVRKGASYSDPALYFYTSGTTGKNSPGHDDTIITNFMWCHVKEINRS